MDGLIPQEVRVPLFEKTSTSPSGKYKFNLERTRVKFTNIIITRGVIVSANKPDQILVEIDIQQNPEIFWHCWVQTNEKKTDQKNSVRQEYLLGKGITKGALLVSMATLKVFDLITDFSWRSACVSPGGDKLAVACSKESKKPVRIFDFRNVESPPYAEMKLSAFPEVAKSEPYECDIEWIDNASLKATVPVYAKDKLAFGYDYYCEDFTLSVKGADAIVSTRRYDPTKVHQPVEGKEGHKAVMKS